MNVIASIDPGDKGAISIFNDGELVAIHDLPFIGKELSGGALADILKIYKPKFVFVELVNGNPVRGRKQSGSAMFNFGAGFGVILCALQILSIPYSKVSPQSWKRKAGLLGKDKDASRLKATELFPNFADQFKRKKDDGRAESALIGWTQITQNQ